MNPRVYVIGCGSIGRRHIENLRSLGVSQIAAFDLDAERLTETEKVYGVKGCSMIDEGYDFEPDAVFVCTPPSLHLSHASQAVAAGCHLFIEKPLGNSIDGFDFLLSESRKRSRIVCIGYNWRFHPGLMKIKRMIDKGVIGDPMSIRAEYGQYLPDWRPSEDFRKAYTVNAAMGGGIILDGSHELDYVRWFGGEVESVNCISGKVSGLEIDVEDTAEITLRMAKGIIGQVHVDFSQRAYTRTCKVMGREGTLIWDYGVGLHHYDSKTKTWQHESFQFKPNTMYLEEVKHFLDCIREKATPLVDGETGKVVLMIALAAIRSAKERREVVPWEI